MPFFKVHKKQKPGKPIEARTLREMAETCDRVDRIQANPPLEAISAFSGPLIRLAGPLFGVYIGVTNGTITARVGTTPGAGSVTIQTWNGSALASLGIDVPVFSISSTTGGIPTGIYCIVLRICGNYWLITVDCGN